SGEGDAAEKFWALEKRIQDDKYHPGVTVEMKRSQMLINLRRLYDSGVIRAEDLDGFSDELREAIYISKTGSEDKKADEEKTHAAASKKKIISMERELAQIINSPEEGVALFHELADLGINISYSVVTKGENKGMIRVRKSRIKDGEFCMELEKYLRRRGRAAYLDHVYYFRTDDDRTLVTMSPYMELEELKQDLPKNGKPHKLGAYSIWVSTHSIYGNRTPTICAWENI
ncbi:MAG: hypothetical protein LIV24_09245, partial [Eubacterium sp.]|nr:hypothetical protein [Eubacterium sp.]